MQERGNENCLKKFLEKIHEETGKHNAELIKDYCEKLRATPTEPGSLRIYTMAGRLKSCALILNKNLDELEEKDLIRFNNTMRERGMKASKYYRRAIKQFLKLTDKKKFIDLLDSPYLANPKSKNGETHVNPDEFWTQQQISDYVRESKHHSLRQTAWAGLWLSTGCRPHELFGLKKENVAFSDETLTVRVERGKTGARTIILNGGEGPGIWSLVNPYLNTLKNGSYLFPTSYEAQAKIHKRICAKIGIPEGNARKFYIARKMAVTNFYDKHGLVKGAALSGHVPGSHEMKYYVAMTEGQFMAGIARLEKKTCPNPVCGTPNEAGTTHCAKCQAPLNKEAYRRMLEHYQQKQAGLIRDLIHNEVQDALAPILMQKMDKIAEGETPKKEKNYNSKVLR